MDDWSLAQISRKLRKPFNNIEMDVNLVAVPVGTGSSAWVMGKSLQRRREAGGPAHGDLCIEKMKDKRARMHIRWVGWPMLMGSTGLGLRF